MCGCPEAGQSNRLEAREAGVVGEDGWAGGGEAQHEARSHRSTVAVRVWAWTVQKPRE